MPNLWPVLVFRFIGLQTYFLDPPQFELQAPTLEARLNPILQELLELANALIYHSLRFLHQIIAIGTYQLAALRELENLEAVIKTLGVLDLVYLAIPSRQSQILSRICLSQSSPLLA